MIPIIGATKDPEDCDHGKVVTFDEKAAAGLTPATVRRQWPRFSGTCPDCGFTGIIYASWMHYIMGDW